MIDTGVARDNREFADALSGTRVTNGIDAQCEDFPFNCNFGNVPCSLESPGSGHGTHVAAILGGRTFGIARDVNIVPIKALCENYTTEEVKQGFEAVLILHSAAQPTAVVNISGLNTQCFADPDCADGDQIRQALIAVASRDNILVVQSAGNQSGLQLQDACDYSFGDEGRYPNPDDAAAIARILIAAGSDEEDGRWRWQSGEPGEPSEQIGSNIGGCVDLFAPAAHIASAYFPVDPGPNDPNEIVCQLSGTSMAAPHVAGVAAMILQNDPRIGPETLRTRILNWAERDSLEVNPADPGYIGAGSPNLLLHWDPSAIMRDGFEAGDLRAWTETSP